MYGQDKDTICRGIQWDLLWSRPPQRSGEATEETLSFHPHLQSTVALCSVFFSIAVVKYSDQKQFRGRKDYTVIRSQFISEGSQSRNLKEKPGMLLACSPCRPGWPWLHKDLPASVSQVLELKVYHLYAYALSSFLTSPGPCPGNSAAHKGLGPQWTDVASLVWTNSSVHLPSQWL